MSPHMSSTTHMLVAGSAVVTVAVLNHLSDHKASVEEFSLYFGCCVCVAMSFFLSFKAVAIVSLCSSLGCFLFAPIVLEFTHSSIIKPFVELPFGTRLQPNLENFKFLDIITYENISIGEAKEIVYHTKVPLLFKGLIHDAIHKGNNIIDRVSAKGEIYLTQRFMAKPYDFFRGSQFTNGHPATVADTMKSLNNDYISFEPLLTKEEVADLLDDDLKNRHIVDDSFISNFNETIVTTFVHGAPASMSWAAQLIGKKTWFLWDPSIVKRMNGGWFCRVSLPALGDEADLFSHPPIKVTITPGDVLVFPPLYYHTVVTHKGPNLMLNMRTRFGNWLPTVIPAIRFFTASTLVLLFGRSNPHHMHGLRHLRRIALDTVFENAPETMRWDPVEKFI